MTFPKLKTGAVAQYPGRRTLRYQNQALRFVDGSEQRYRDSAGVAHEWEITLSQLDEGELAAVGEFVTANQGRYGSFAFTDPWDGAVYADCSLVEDAVSLVSEEEMMGRAMVRIRENRK